MTSGLVKRVWHHRNSIAEGITKWYGVHHHPSFRQIQQTRYIFVDITGLFSLFSASEISEKLTQGLIEQSND